MQRRPNPFAATGAANSFLANFEDLGMKFEGCDDQRHLTPLQRQIIDAERARRAKAQQERMEEAQSGNQSQAAPAQQGRVPNSRASSGDDTQTQTTRYINTNENPDYNFD